MNEFVTGGSRLPRPAAGEARPRCVVRACGGAWILELGGVLPLGWCGHLALHCFGAGLDIEQGDARRVGGGRWVGAFRLRPLRAGTPPEGFDFVRMAVRRPVLTLDPGALPLRRLHLAPPAGEGEPARLSLEADDEPGLLARVLGCCDAAGLQLTRLSLRTRSAVAHDRFWLHGADGGSPREPELARLRALLGELRSR